MGVGIGLVTRSLEEFLVNCFRYFSLIVIDGILVSCMHSL